MLNILQTYLGELMDTFKPNLEAFNDRPDLTFVINRFNYIESVLNNIIFEYISPDSARDNFVKSILLNTAIVSFGSKLKLFFHMNATEGWSKLQQNKFHRLTQIRNQFAHTGKEIINISMDTETNDCESETCLMLESVAGSGKLVEVDSKEALDEFTQLYAEIREILHEVLNKLRKVG